MYDDVFDTEDAAGIKGEVEIQRFEELFSGTPSTAHYRQRQEQFDKEVEAFLNDHTWYDIDEYHIGDKDAFIRGVRILYDPESGESVNTGRDHTVNGFLDIPSIEKETDRFMKSDYPKHMADWAPDKDKTLPQQAETSGTTASDDSQYLFSEDVELGLDKPYRLQLFGHYQSWPSFYPGSNHNRDGSKEDWTDTYSDFIEAIESFQTEHRVFDIQIGFSANDSGIYHEAWIMYEDEGDKVNKE